MLDFEPLGVEVGSAVRSCSREAAVELLRLALGWVELLDELLLDPLPEVVAEGVGSAACGDPRSVASTGRNCICDDAAIASCCSLVGTPGMATTMLDEPRVVTSAPEVPCASMRWTMMSRASSSCCWETEPPSVLRGERMNWKPPSRSSPSAGVHEASFFHTP